MLSRFFYAASVPLLVVAIIYGLRYMPSRRTNWTVKLDVGLAWFAALSTLVLVPTDVATAMQVGPEAPKPQLAFPACLPAVLKLSDLLV